MSESTNILLNQINLKLEKIKSNSQGNSLIVLKGIPLSIVQDYRINLETIFDDKFKYVINNIYNKRSIITYEEFLIEYELIVSLYENIYVLKNNLYLEVYPIEQMFSNNVRNGLLNHFMEQEDDSNDDLEIGNIDSLISIYSGMKEDNSLLFGGYEDDKTRKEIKVHTIPLFDESDYKLENRTNPRNVHEIKDEISYINFVKFLLNTDENDITVKVSYFEYDRMFIVNQLQIIASYWKDIIDISLYSEDNTSVSYETKPEFKQILKRYWGHDDFRMISTYDLEKIDNNEKKLITISQEQIISELVNEVEKCDSPDKNYRDMFVTAPTGAGKSVMFQIPAIYLAEKYNLVTIVISPLIGLMNDQVEGLRLRDCTYAKTINSDISPIVKQEIMQDIADGNTHILYLSPETLLSRSDIEYIIGDRTIGMIVVDEAHIVTTWGKQFRPDYWYLGDHITKLRKKQEKNVGRSFVIATFTATAIYKGYENMFQETIASLHLQNPIVHLGLVKRNDLTIDIQKHEKIKNTRDEYELNKMEDIENLVKRAQITEKKTLIYFPTVALIERCYTHLKNRRMISIVAKYYGPLQKELKEQYYKEFLNGEKTVMLATKAFGMGIDIDDIEIVAHYAPTGNVCDYVQEIGRAARKSSLSGEAYYKYDDRDFGHINRLHGLSAIKHYQLVNVIEKIYELYQNSLQQNSNSSITRKRNAMLIDAENFTYIFPSPFGEDDGNAINKVKTALLLIQKDFENTYGFSPINTRPIPLFSIGYFSVEKETQKKLMKKYGNCIDVISSENNICRVRLDSIWKKGYEKYSFPKFKYLVYSNNSELSLNNEYKMVPALCVNINLFENYRSKYFKLTESLKNYLSQCVRQGLFVNEQEISDFLVNRANYNKYRAPSITSVLIASIKQYMSLPATSGMIRIMNQRQTASGLTEYRFTEGISFFFSWLESKMKYIESNIDNENNIYIINNGMDNVKEFNLALGILESFDIMSFKMIGGANSQIYIYINQIQKLQNIVQAPYTYKNKMLETITNRHKISVLMLTYLFQNDLSSNQRWDTIENYFLGSIPTEVDEKAKEIISNS